MKPFFNFSVVFFILISFSVLFVGCSNESGIASPNKSNTVPIAKMSTIVASIPTVKFDHSADTVINLPQSGKKILISKSISAVHLAKIDKYLSTHKIAPVSAQSITPNLPSCNQHIEVYYVLENQYVPATGRNMGVLTSVERPYQLYNQYGFTYYFANGLSVATDTSVTNYFPISNLMVPVPFDNSWSYQSIYNTLNTYPAYNYYYTDEPAENVNMSVSTIQNIAIAISSYSSTAKFLFSDYQYPELSWCWDSGDGTSIKDYYLEYPNTYYVRSVPWRWLRKSPRLLE